MEPPPETELCFVTWNTTGVVTKLGSKKKKFYIIEELKRKNAKIVFLQETHIGSNNYTALRSVDGWKCFFTVYDSRSKGVAILIRDDVQFKYICHDEDYSGGYLVLFCYLDKELFTLVNVYNHKHDTEILNRLQEYLRETAEGVLVVGGDFNTVLDLSFDQKELLSRPLRCIFKEFTASLNLMDTWAHLHPTDRAFTRSQNDSSPRLDMFLMPEDIIERVGDVRICKPNKINMDSTESTKMRTISDHDLVVLTFTLKEKTKHKKHNIASWLKKHKYSRDDRAGKINGAEILSVIKSMIDSGQKHPNDESVKYYKTNRCPFTECLKKEFNEFLYRKHIHDRFKINTGATGIRKTFNVDYLIFTMILAKRLRMLLLVHPENQSQLKTDCYIVTLQGKPVKIKWTFLKKILSDLCETWNTIKREKNQPLGDFRILEAIGLPEDLGILDSILPKVSCTSEDLRELQEDCPLTRTLHSLILKYLEIHINKKDYDTHICYARQVVVIHSYRQGPVEDRNLEKELSGFRKNINEVNISEMDEN